MTSKQTSSNIFRLGLMAITTFLIQGCGSGEEAHEFYPVEMTDV